MKTITLKFKDSDDLKFFEKYMAMAKAQEGTITGLYCGLMCSALKRSEVVQSPNPELLEACRMSLHAFETGNSEISAIASLKRAISKAEGQS